jgi:hypothetical protein
MRKTGLISDGAKAENIPDDASDVFVPARGIARGVIGGAIVWVVLLTLSIGLLSL